MPQILKPHHTGIQVADLPRRAVVWAQRRRPAPSAATRATLTVIRDLLAVMAPAQPGVHVGPAAFPLARSGG